MTTPEAEKIGLGIKFVQGAAKIYMRTENPENINLEQVRPVMTDLFSSLLAKKYTMCEITKVLLLKAFEE